MTGNRDRERNSKDSREPRSERQKKISTSTKDYIFPHLMATKSTHHSRKWDHSITAREKERERVLYRGCMEEESNIYIYIESSAGCVRTATSGV